MVPEKTPNLKLKKPDYENGVADIRIFNENWDILDNHLVNLNKQEIENLLGFNVINQEFILATLDDIKNLFPGSGGTSGAFDLGHISSDETKIVNMLLLSNYNEYLQQKILQIKDFFNNLNSNKADKTALDNYYAKQEIDSKVNLLESTKADKTTKIIVGDGLLGTGSLESKINITVDNLSDEEIQSLMTNWR